MSLTTVFLKFDNRLGYTKAIIPSEDEEFFIIELGFTRTIPAALAQKETKVMPEKTVDKRPMEAKLKDPDTGWGEQGTELWNLRMIDSINSKIKIIEFIKEVTHFTIKLDNKALPEIKLEAAKLLKSHHKSN